MHGGRKRTSVVLVPSPSSSSSSLSKSKKRRRLEGVSLGPPFYGGIRLVFLALGGTRAKRIESLSIHPLQSSFQRRGKGIMERPLSPSFLSPPCDRRTHSEQHSLRYTLSDNKGRSFLSSPFFSPPFPSSLHFQSLPLGPSRPPLLFTVTSPPPASTNSSLACLFPIFKGTFHFPAFRLRFFVRWGKQRYENLFFEYESRCCMIVGRVLRIHFKNLISSL